MARVVHWARGEPESGVHISAKVDYGMRALLALVERGEPATAESLAVAQGLPARFLGAILIDLRRAGIVSSQRGADGGYRLARPAADISVADVMRALDGPLAEVRGLRPEAAHYEGAAVVDVVVVLVWCLAAVGDDEPHAAAARATATTITTGSPRRHRPALGPVLAPNAPCSTTPTPFGHGAAGVPPSPLDSLRSTPKSID